MICQRNKETKTKQLCTRYYLDFKVEEKVSLSLDYFLLHIIYHVSESVMEYPTLPLSHVAWLYTQWAQYYTSSCPGDKADCINLLLALPSPAF